MVSVLTTTDYPHTQTNHFIGPPDNTELPHLRAVYHTFPPPSLTVSTTLSQCLLEPDSPLDVFDNMDLGALEAVDLGHLATGNGVELSGVAAFKSGGTPELDMFEDSILRVPHLCVTDDTCESGAESGASPVANTSMATMDTWQHTTNVHMTSDTTNKCVTLCRAIPSPQPTRISPTEPSNLPRSLPCAARNMNRSHNAAHFLLTTVPFHGMLLRCSDVDCLPYKFVYCGVCERAVAKRNFKKRHRHGTTGKVVYKKQVGGHALSAVLSAAPPRTAVQESVARTVTQAAVAGVTVFAHTAACADKVLPCSASVTARRGKARKGRAEVGRWANWKGRRDAGGAVSEGRLQEV